MHPADLSRRCSRTARIACIPATEITFETLFNKDSTISNSMHRRKDGTGFPAEVLFSAFDYGGRRVLQATVRDITLRRKCRKRIVKLSVAVEQNPATIVITDRSGNIEYVNREILRGDGIFL